MYIKELRALLENYTKKELSDTLVELYKTIPKAIKEERQVDDLILSAGELKATTQKNSPSDIQALISETKQFITHADQMLYAYPNKRIGKKDRSNWRFKVRRLLKQLELIPAVRDHGQEVTQLLESLFLLLNKSYTHYIFVSRDAFSAIGRTSLELYQMIVQRRLIDGVDAQKIRELIALVNENYLATDYRASHYLVTLIEQLPTTASLELAIDTAKEMVPQFLVMEPQKDAPNDYLSYRYAIQQAYEHLVEFITDAYFKLYEYEEAIAWHWENTRELNQTLIYSSIISKLYNRQQDALFIRECDKAIAAGIPLSPKITALYQKAKTQLP